MNESDAIQKMRSALASSAAHDQLVNLVISIKSEGTSEQSIYDWLKKLRKEFENEPDEVREDIILEVLDFVWRGMQ